MTAGLSCGMSLVMRYPEGGGLDAAERIRREVRLASAEFIEAGPVTRRLWHPGARAGRSASSPPCSCASWRRCWMRVRRSVGGMSISAPTWIAEVVRRQFGVGYMLARTICLSHNLWDGLQDM